MGFNEIIHSTTVFIVTGIVILSIILFLVFRRSFLFAIGFLIAVIQDKGFINISILLARLTLFLNKKNYLSIGLGCYHCGKIHKSKEAFLSLLKYKEFSGNAIYYLSRLKHNLREHYIIAVESLDDSSYDEIQQLISRYINIEDFQKVVRIKNEFSLDFVEKSRLYMLMAFYFFYKEDLKDLAIDIAKIALGKSLKQYSTVFLPLYVDYANMYLDQNKPKEALETLNFVKSNLGHLEGKPYTSELYYLIGKAYEQINNKSSAEHAYNKSFNTCKASYFGKLSRERLTELN
ncbi:MAG: hypothetical protein AB1782_00155 [Cyanobacteriota bacterium]